MNSAGYSVFDEPIRAREKCYSPARLRLMVDIYRGAKRRGIYLALGIDPNSHGYRELREPIRARENGYRLLW